MPEEAPSYFRDRMRNVRLLVAVALVGAASLPEVVQAQTSLPPINVIGTPPGGGGFGGYGGYGNGDVTGCGYDCDGSANGPVGFNGISVPHVSSDHETTCNNPDATSRHLSALHDFSVWRAHGNFWSVSVGDYIEVSYSDGGSETWAVVSLTSSDSLAPVPVPGTHRCD